MEIPGQILASRVLSAVLRREGAARQLLFWGPPGVGKREAARSLAWTLVDPGREHGPESQSLDFRWVSASGENLRLEEIDPALADLATLPHGPGRRVVVIDEPERLRAQDGRDRLLKALEEPGPRSTIVLVTDHLDRVAATIRSRCLPVPFRTPGRARLVELLIERGCSADDAEIVARAAGPAALAGGPADWELTVTGHALGNALAGGADPWAIVEPINAQFERIVAADESAERRRLRQELEDKQAQGTRGVKTATKRLEDQYKRELRRFSGTGWRRAIDAAASSIARHERLGPESRADLLALIDQARADLVLNPDFTLWVSGLLTRAAQIRAGEAPRLVEPGRLP